MLRRSGKYQINGTETANRSSVFLTRRTYESDVKTSKHVTSASAAADGRSGNPLFHVVGSRKEQELVQLNGQLEDEESMVGQLQKKIKELQVSPQHLFIHCQLHSGSLPPRYKILWVWGGGTLSMQFQLGFDQAFKI